MMQDYGESTTDDCTQTKTTAPKPVEESEIETLFVAAPEPIQTTFTQEPFQSVDEISNENPSEITVKTVRLYDIVPTTDNQTNSSDNVTLNVITKSENMPSWVYDIERITEESGICYGPSGKETYYNLPMDGVIYLMRSLGFSEKEYPYWVRNDGVKMFGEYVMVAANLQIRPKGTIVETSLGTGMVCDTGEFAFDNKYQLDIAVDW